MGRKSIILKKSLHQLLFILLIPLLSYAAVTTRIMPLGDSITYGTHNGTLDPETDVAYRLHLWNALNNAGYTFDFVGSQTGGTDYAPPFDPDNEGHPGESAAEIAAGVYNYLKNNPADIALLHIGTNELRTDTTDVSAALNEIDRYERDFNRHVSVILARIINRATDAPESNETDRQMTSEFNNNLETMAQNRIANGDDIVVVDMEKGAGIDYSIATDMVDYLHLSDTGYAKMARLWFDALTTTIPVHQWKFDETDDVTSFEDSYRGNHAACSGNCPQAAPGRLDGAQLFEGNSEITISDDDSFDWDGNESFTLEFWTKSNRAADNTENQVIIGRNDMFIGELTSRA